MFHSGGTVQSNALVPDGTSCTSKGTYDSSAASVSRTPSPVMLRHMGNKCAHRSCISKPTSAGSSVDECASLDMRTSMAAVTNDSTRSLRAQRTLVRPQFTEDRVDCSLQFVQGHG